jgi:hypothetical protein
MKSREDEMKPLAILVTVLLAGTVLAAQDDPLKTARDLYAAASYEETLSELTRVGSAPGPDSAREIDAYRMFCLVALERTEEAETIAESLVRQDPMLKLDRYREASPRIVTMFATVRTRMLPQLIRDEYRRARALATEKAPGAESRLTRLLQLLGDAEKIGVWDETLADVRLLAEGFLELSRAPARPTSSAPVPPATVTIEEPATAESTPPPSAPIIVKEGDAGVVAPVVIFQPAPHASYVLRNKLQRPGKFDVVINERGLVENVTVRQSIIAAYDALVVATARTWRYLPATKDGVPVKCVKTITINVPPQ